VAESFEECSVWVQAMVVAYGQIRNYEEAKRDALLAKLRMF
jgi:hypothetical protein